MLRIGGKLQVDLECWQMFLQIPQEVSLQCANLSILQILSLVF